MKVLLSIFLSLVCSLPTLSFGSQGQRDNWRSVRTNNLFVIGNADADSLRQVAGWLEFFHGAFARLTSRSTIDSSVPTTVIVFRDDSSFVPFKPIYQGKAANVAGPASRWFLRRPRYTTVLRSMPGVLIRRGRFPEIS